MTSSESEFEYDAADGMESSVLEEGDEEEEALDLTMSVSIESDLSLGRGLSGGLGLGMRGNGKTAVMKEPQYDGSGSDGEFNL